MKIDWVGVDIDGVLADFVGMACRVHHRMDVTEHYATMAPGEYDTFKLLGMTKSDFWHAIHRHGETFWAILEPYPWAYELISLCQSVARGNVALVTTPSESPYSAAGKLQWIERHFPELHNSYYLCHDKSKLAARGRLLIDDNDDNCSAWSAAGGVAFLWPQPWNQKHGLTPGRLDYFKAFLGVA